MDTIRKLSDYQCEELEHCAEVLRPKVFSYNELVENGSFDLLHHLGIYAFLRSTIIPRIYLGMTERGEARLEEQLHLRRWSSTVIFFQMEGYLHRETLKLLEGVILAEGKKRLSNVLWDNEAFLEKRDFFEIQNRSPSLAQLANKILQQIIIRMPDPSSADYEALKPTHKFISSKRQAYGLLLKKTNGWTYLLPGSRIHSDYQNLRDIEKNPEVWMYLSKPYWEGNIVWRKAATSRPAGFVLRQPMQFRSTEQAIQLLLAGRTLQGHLKSV